MTKQFKSFYVRPQIISEIISNLNFDIKDVKTRKKQQKVHCDRLKRFNSRIANTDKKKLTGQKRNREYHKMTLRRRTNSWNLK